MLPSKASGMMHNGLKSRSASLAGAHAVSMRPAHPSCHQHSSVVLPGVQAPCQQLRSGLGCPSGHIKALQSQRLAAVVADKAGSSTTAPEQRPLKVLIAGAGIGGLVLAVALIKKGIDVVVFERDLTAIRGEGKYRGPIQVRCGVVCW